MGLKETTTRVQLCEDGKYRWTYALNMYRNPAILVTVLKIVCGLFSVPVIVELVRTAVSGDWAEAWGDNLWASGLKIWLLIFILFFFLSLLSYLIVALVYGGRYVVHFTLDEKHLVHETVGRQARKGSNMGILTALVGAAAKSPTTAGAGLLAATKTTSTSDLAYVRRIKVRRAFDLIKVNQILGHNQAYVPAEDFDMVLAFLRKHCPNAKVS